MRISVSLRSSKPLFRNKNLRASEKKAIKKLERIFPLRYTIVLATGEDGIDHQGACHTLSSAWAGILLKEEVCQSRLFKSI